jgi:hypothetical protein
MSKLEEWLWCIVALECMLKSPRWLARSEFERVMGKNK